MKTNLTARNLDLDDGLRAQIEHKLQRLDRITHRDAEAEVELTTKASHAADAANVADVILVNNGNVLRSSASGPTPMAALDIVVDKLERQVVRTKERPRSVRERHHDEAVSVLSREAAKSVDPDDERPAEGTESAPSIVKMKRFDLSPMFAEDAIAEMEALGHAFFVFLDAETDRVAVLYRRKPGDYGLIDPVLDQHRGRTR